jgi:hypothetical protein
MERLMRRRSDVLVVEHHKSAGAARTGNNSTLNLEIDRYYRLYGSEFVVSDFIRYKEALTKHLPATELVLAYTFSYPKT